MIRLVAIAVVIALVAIVGYLLWRSIGPGSLQWRQARHRTVQEELDRKVFEREVRRWD